MRIICKCEFWVEAQFSHGSRALRVKQGVQDSPHGFPSSWPRSDTEVECLNPPEVSRGSRKKNIIQCCCLPSKDGVTQSLLYMDFSLLLGFLYGRRWQQLRVLPQASAISEGSSLSPSVPELLPHSVLAGPQFLCRQVQGHARSGDDSRLLGASCGCDCSTTTCTRDGGRCG